MRILVTGGAGFIGSHLCERLVEDGHDVLALDDLSTGRLANIWHLADRCCQCACRPAESEPLPPAPVGDVCGLGGPRFEFVLGNVAVREGLRGLCGGFVDVVYLLACPASPVAYLADPTKTLATSFIGTLHGLEFGRRCDATVVLASSSEVYGDATLVPTPEGRWGIADMLSERACYAEGKRAAEALCLAYQRQYGVDTRIARLFNVYGPRMRPDDGRVVSSMVAAALRGEPLPVHGDGKQTRSFCYVDDAVEALVRLGTMANVVSMPKCDRWLLSDPINIGSPQEQRIAAVASLVGAAVLGCEPEIARLAFRPGDVRRRCPDIARARRLLGWEPQVELADGLGRTIAWMREKLKA